jgi:hypothetical protein
MMKIIGLLCLVFMIGLNHLQRMSGKKLPGMLQVMRNIAGKQVYLNCGVKKGTRHLKESVPVQLLK